MVMLRMVTTASVTPAVDANTVLVTRWSSNAIRPESGREGPAVVRKNFVFKAVVPKPRRHPLTKTGALVALGVLSGHWSLNRQTFHLYFKDIKALGRRKLSKLPSRGSME